MTTEKWTVELTKSVNGIEFCLPRKMVRNKINREFKEFRKGSYSKSTTDDYSDFHVFYDKKNRFIAIEIFTNISVIVNSTVIFPGKLDQALQIIPDLEKDGDGYISVKDSVGIYAPEGVIESILFGKSDYYKSETNLTLINTIIDKFSHKHKSPPAAHSALFEFCPRCGANLTLQKGYNNQLPYWICRGCGEMLINPAVDNADDDIAWICDQCGAMLNIQPGFNAEVGKWKCTECGFENIIDQSEIYASDAEYQAELRNPYRGLSDDDTLRLSLYQEEELIRGRDDIILVRHRETGVLYIKKLLGVYDKSVYMFLVDHPIRHMPRIKELFESDNCLIVIEEYIDGRTLADLLEEGVLPEKRAVSLAVSICRILEELHSLSTPIVHRDVKPSNIMIDKDGEVILLDMNVAKWYDPDKTGDTRCMGTKEYAAPEQAGYGLEASSAKSDIYALGILLNVMITGQYPRDKRADGEIWKIIERCISLDANERYTAKELMDELTGLEERQHAAKHDGQTG